MENKFRAWNKKNKKWVDGLFSFFMKGKDVGYARYEGKEPCYIEICYSDGIELNQFTGIKDKNNKEIYEGDIIKTRFGIGRVVYNDCRYLVNDFHIQLNHCIPFDIEILGNIYEDEGLRKEYVK